MLAGRLSRWKFHGPGNQQQYCKKCGVVKAKEREHKRAVSLNRKNWFNAYYTKNKAVYNKRSKKHYKKFRSKILEYQKENRINNHEIVKMREYAYKHFRNELLKKAQYRCQNCNKKGNLHLHHKEYTQHNKKEFRNEDIKKIVVLCPKCHRLLHERINL